MGKDLKTFKARYASRWRSTRHIEAHLRFPRMDFHEALTRVTYKRKFGVWPDLENPRTISEKMCWLKINDRRPINAVITDKYRMRGYAENLGLGHLLNQLHEVWNTAAEIDFSALPDAYALKVTNGSAWNMIKRPGTPINENTVRRRLDHWMNTNMADNKGEWYYGASPSRIIAERYLVNDQGDMPNYQLYVFNGETRMINYFDRCQSGLRGIFMTPDWRPYPFTWSMFGTFCLPPPKPAKLDEMINLARTLSPGFPLIRVDFYIHEGRPLIGELTLNPAAGYTVFTPGEWNLKIGDWLELSNKAMLAA